ncbi:MAG: HEPN domain-containing protein [Bacteroidota bacterium]
MKARNKEERILLWLDKSNSTLKEIESHIENEFINTSANRIYFACFYAVTAFLISINLESKTHSGIRTLFGRHLIQANLLDKKFGKFYTEIFDYRKEVDYDEFTDLEMEDIKSIFEEAKELVAEIERLLSEKK